MTLTEHDIAELTQLEEAMWKADTRFDPDFQAVRFATDFFEFGRSGRVYTRAQAVRNESEKQEIKATLPLDSLSFRLLDEHTVQLSYNSHVDDDGAIEHARRSSIWTKTDLGWVMRFHQGTPYQPTEGCCQR